MNQSSLLVLLAIAGTGCRTSEPEDRAPDLAPYVADARVQNDTPVAEHSTELT